MVVAVADRLSCFLLDSGTIFDKFLQKAKHVYNEER